MGILNGLKHLFIAKSNEAEQKIEDNNIISFSQEDIRKMDAELLKAKSNFGDMKATLSGIERNILSKKEELELNKSKAKALKEQGATDPVKMELAIKVAGKCVSINDELVGFEQQRVLIAEKVEQQRKAVESISENVTQAKRDLQFMKAQEQVTKSTEALSSVNTNGVQTTLNKFAERKEKLQHKMDKANAMVEADNANNLDAQVESALGTKSLKSQSFLDSL